MQKNKVTKDSKKEGKSFFQKNKVALIIGGVAVLVIAIGTIVAVNIINQKKQEEAARVEEQKNNELLANFQNVYLMTTGSYTEEQGKCVWGQIELLVNKDDILAAAKEYDENGMIAGGSTFANKVYSSIDNVYKKCEVQTEDARKTIDKITDVIDVTLTGNGTASSDVFKLKSGLAEITITGPEDITLSLETVDNGYSGCFESFSGSGYPAVSQTKTYSKKCTIDYAGDYYFDVHISGYKIKSDAWTINIRQD